MPQTATPTILPAAGSRYGAILVSMADATPGSLIYYEQGVNPPDPTVLSTLYNGTPFQVNPPQTIKFKAIGITAGFTDSAIASSTYILLDLPVPTLTPPAGNYPGPQLVTLSTPAPNVNDFVYRINSGAWTLYAGPFLVTPPAIVESYAEIIAPVYWPSVIGFSFYGLAKDYPDTVDTVGNRIAKAVQIFGRLPNGDLAAVAVDADGNLMVTGGGSGSLNPVDVIKNGRLQPMMIYGRLSGIGPIVAVNLNANGALSVTTGGGAGCVNPVDVASNGECTPVTIYGRAPNNQLVAVALDSGGNLCTTIGKKGKVNPIDVLHLTQQYPNRFPTRVILCGRPTEGPTAKEISAVALDATGALAVSSGGGGSLNVVDKYVNGTPMKAMVYGRAADEKIYAVGLDPTGNFCIS